MTTTRITWTKTTTTDTTTYTASNGGFQIIQDKAHKATPVLYRNGQPVACSWDCVYEAKAAAQRILDVE